MPSHADEAMQPLTAMERLRPPYPLRRHQREALARLADALAAGDGRAGGEGRDGGEGGATGGAEDADVRQGRAWVVLPPGMGKTLVGLEAARRLGDPVVVFTPNTAIQGQWLREWGAFVPEPDTRASVPSLPEDTRAASPAVPAGTDRDLNTPVTVLTYQSLASFDPDAEVDEDGARTSRTAVRHLNRLRPQGLALVEALRRTGRFTLLLDECHHLLDTWGELLAELLRELPEATVVGLTATPPDRLTPPQVALVRELFGPAVQGPSIPAAVREGHLAPYAELCWLTTPTPVEADWLAAEAERFTELTTALLDPGFASRPFLDWLDERFVARRGPDGSPVPWSGIERERPELAAAALRFHHSGLLALPEGARPREEHRRAPGAEDWVRLLDDWVRLCLRRSGSPQDADVLDALRTALPSVGHQLTARGIRGGRSPVDRVLARSAAKPHAVREILAAEDRTTGDALRAVIVCDHERATATLPARLDGVLEAEAGSALLVLQELAADPRTAALDPLLVTGRTVAASRATARRLVEFCREAAPRLTLTIEPLTDGQATCESDACGCVVVVGGCAAWNSRRWVALATRFFEQGGSRALIGTRGMLGEGWDARRVNTLVDLTEATTPTAVVQTRGRALRLDPEQPHKVANTWSVVCVADGHPRGDGDWNRFVRKHDGYLGLTDAGEVMVGVSHVHPELSPYAPPDTGEFDRLNAVMLQRAAARDEVRSRWRIGEPYEDELVHTLRVTVPRRAAGAGPVLPPGDDRTPPAVPAPQGLSPSRLPAGPALSRTALAGAFATAAPLIALPWPAAVAAGGLAACTAYAATRTAAALAHLRRTAASPVPVLVAWATADALHAAGLVPRGADAVSFEPDETGAYRVKLDGVPAAASALFATAFDEAVSPLASPRYVVPRYVLAPPSAADAVRALRRRPVPNTVVHHAVPSVLAENRRLADVFAARWNVYVSAGGPLYTRSPEGAGVLAAQAGGSPLEVTTAMRVTWR
ncbi:DEAD/DEAH box helicase family protein [Streptomyces ovatisporus]|uniref:DEAD/DEAH box helicase family protein n=1 Tax=Streptomyces ovatisporus TaxID=1128682 RepID=A0ABV9ACC3_9ACTN